MKLMLQVPFSALKPSANGLFWVLLRVINSRKEDSQVKMKVLCCFSSTRQGNTPVSETLITIMQCDVIQCAPVSEEPSAMPDESTTDSHCYRVIWTCKQTFCCMRRGTLFNQTHKHTQAHTYRSVYKGATGSTGVENGHQQVRAS